MWCCNGRVFIYIKKIFFTFHAVVSQSVSPHPADLKRNRIRLHSENLSFITYTIKFMISLTTYFDTFKTILSSYFYFPFSFSIEVFKYGLFNRRVHVFCRHMFCCEYAHSAIHKCIGGAIHVHVHSYVKMQSVLHLLFVTPMHFFNYSVYDIFKL